MTSCEKGSIRSILCRVYVDYYYYYYYYIPTGILIFEYYSVLHVGIIS